MTIKTEELEKELRHYTGTEAYHKLGFGRIVATDGVKAFCEKAEAFWLFTDIEAYYMCNKVDDEFKLWILDVKEDGTAVLTCQEDSDTEVLVEQKYNSVSIPFGTWKFYIINKVMLLTNEY